MSGNPDHRVLCYISSELHIMENTPTEENSKHKSGLFSIPLKCSSVAIPFTPSSSSHKTPRSLTFVIVASINSPTLCATNLDLTPREWEGVFEFTFFYCQKYCGQLRPCLHLTFAFTLTSVFPLNFKIISMVLQWQMQRIGVHRGYVCDIIDTMLTLNIDGNANVTCEQTFTLRESETFLRTSLPLNVKSKLSLPRIHFVVTSLSFCANELSKSVYTK